MDEIPLLQRPLVVLDEEEAFADQHEEALLARLGVVEPARLSGAQDLQLYPDLRKRLRRDLGAPSQDGPVRLERARADGVPAFVVFHDTTLVEIARQQPQELWQLAKVSGVGPTKLERYGEELLARLGSPR